MNSITNAKPKKPDEIPAPGRNPETIPSKEPEPGVWPRKDPELQPGKEPLTIPPVAPPEVPAPPETSFVIATFDPSSVSGALS